MVGISLGLIGHMFIATGLYAKCSAIFLPTIGMYICTHTHTHTLSHTQTHTHTLTHTQTHTHTHTHTPVLFCGSVVSYQFRNPERRSQQE